MKDTDQEILFLVDESYSKNFCATCIVCIQGLDNKEMVLDQIRKIGIDPVFRTYNPSGSIHYNENSISARQSLAAWINEMPISVYIIMTEVSIPQVKQNQDSLAYEILFPEILKPLLMKFQKRSKSPNFTIYFENITDKFDKDIIFFKKIVNDDKINVQVKTKDTEPLIFLPDYFLGFMNDHHQLKKGETWPTETLRLLAGKIGLILTSNNGTLKRYERGEGIDNFLI